MTTWLHITSSYTWKRPAVGVIRVEQELFAALARQGAQDLRYCVFVGADLIEVSASVMEIKPEAAGTEKQWGFVRSKIWSLWVILRGYWLRLAAISPLASRAFQRAKSLRDTLTGREVRTTTWKIAAIQPNDTFISVGHDWALDFQALFAKVTQKHGARLISFCHDLIPLAYPEYCLLSYKKKMDAYFDALFAHSTLVLCNSSCTERDVAKYSAAMGRPKPKTLVIPLGCDVPQGEDLPTNRVGPEGEFILYVSTLERRKNHQTLYNVYAELASQPEFERLPTLCFVGMHGWRVENLLDDMALNQKISHKFMILPNVTDAQLGSLYRRALFCVYPSFYEGWGLPVAEALALGKAVIASDAGALPEASGGFALHLNPYDTKSWRDSILRMTVDHEWRAEWESRIAAGFKPNKWDAAAVLVLEKAL